MIGILLALSNAFAGAFGNITGASATRRAATNHVLLVTATTSLFAAFLVALAVGEATSPAAFEVGFVAGVIGACGLPLCYRAFAIGPVGMVSPVLSCTATVTVVVGAWASSGVIESSTAIGLGLCLAAVLVATLQGKGGTWRVAFLAFGAGLSFGGFSLIIAQAPGAAGLWPLAGARIGVLLFALSFFSISRIRIRQQPRGLTVGDKRWLPLAAISGFAEISANILFLLAVTFGDLAMVSVIQALSPVASVLIGWAMLRQTPTTRHWVAVGIAISALLVIALGSPPKAT